MFINNNSLQIRDFAVNKDFGDDEPFFRIITNAGEVQLNKLPFQQGQPLPDTINCRIKGYNGATPILGHNMPRYVSEFYADGFQKGEEFEFKVISIPEGSKGFYRLTDENGLIFKLQEPKATLSKGQSIKCKFESMSQNFFILRRSNADMKLPMVTLSDISSIIKIHGVGAARIEGHLQQIPELEKALDELSHGRSTWLLTAIRALKPILPRLFGQLMGSYVEYGMISEIVYGYGKLLLHLLQGSGYLRNLERVDRKNIQEELTQQIEQLDVYKRTIKLIADNSERKFIKALLDNLKESGYIYHPTTQFSIMMLLFRVNPELVNTSLGNIFDTLMGWEVETWKTEPFRQAFVEQLQIYIQDTRVEIDNFLQPATPADNEKIEKVLTAIAIQQSLAQGNDKLDLRLNTSLFYRYISLLRTAKADTLLQKAYLSLMGVQLPIDYTWSDIKEPTMMMTRATVDPPANAKLPATSRYYLTEGNEIELNQDGITISKTNQNAINVIYNGMLPWPGLKLNVDLKKTINRSRMKTLEGHAEFWENIEDALLYESEEVAEQSSTQRMPDIDDTVRIVVDRVITSERDINRIEAFECRIVDDHFIETKGYLPAENIVNYNLHAVTLGTFRHDNGEHMKFDAQVVDIDENDNLIFSLLDSTHQAIIDMANSGEKCYAVVTKDNGRSYSAISDKGFGLYINKDFDDTPPFHRGNVVRVMITGYSNDAIQSIVDEGPIDNFTFSNARAFHNLLLAIAVDTDYDNDNNMQLDEDETLSREDIREIIEIFRTKAISNNGDILSTYDLLSYARILALLINDDELVSTLKAQKEILMLHQHYAKNLRLYVDDILRISEEATDSQYVQNMAARLHTVALLGHSEDNNALWKIVNSDRTEMEKELAQMVLSHNLLYEMNHDDPTAADIKKMIAKKLNVDSEQRKLKYYGSESQYVEFKSSLVYPAQKGKSGISMADPDKQEYEILHIIAGFMNTTGGTLYIGVSDDHYEHGLEDDLSFYRLDTSERNTMYRKSIRSIDNMANHLQNLIDKSFNIGQNAGEYAKAAQDDESTKGVIAVKIKPCSRIVYLNDTIYTRHGAKTEPLLRKEDIDMFIADREQYYKQLIAARSNNNEQKKAEETKAPEPYKPVIRTTDEIKEPQEIAQAETTETDQFSISTSKVRKNVLYEYNDPDHFVNPVAYIRFVDDHNYIVTTNQWNLDTESDRLDLTVTDVEADEYLLLVYEGDYVLKVKMREVLSKDTNKALPHFEDRKLIFTCPVSGNGGLYTMHANNKNTLYERVTPIDKIPTGSMNSSPERLLDQDSATTVMLDIVSPEKMGEFSAILSTTMKRAQIGSLVKGQSSIKTSVNEAIEAATKRLS